MKMDKIGDCLQAEHLRRSCEGAQAPLGYCTVHLPTRVRLRSCSWKDTKPLLSRPTQLGIARSPG